MGGAMAILRGSFNRPGLFSPAVRRLLLVRRLRLAPSNLACMRGENVMNALTTQEM